MKSEIINEYFINNNIHRITTKYNISEKRIYSILNNENIILVKNNIKRNEELIIPDNSVSNILNGELLGDGYIIFDSRNAKFRHASKYEEYSKCLLSKLLIYEPKYHIEKRCGKDYYCLNTKVNEYFNELYRKWYIIGNNCISEKIVPEDLELTPEVVYHWYIGDGQLIAKGNGRYARLHIQGFNIKYTNILVEKLKNLDIDSVIRREPRSKEDGYGYYINIEWYSLYNFINYMVKNIIKSFDYKFDIPEYYEDATIYKYTLGEVNKLYGFSTTQIRVYIESSKILFDCKILNKNRYYSKNGINQVEEFLKNRYISKTK